MQARRELFMNEELAIIYIQSLPKVIENTDFDDANDPVLYNQLYWLRHFFENVGTQNAKQFTSEFILAAQSILSDDYNNFMIDHGNCTFGVFLSSWVREEYENCSYEDFTVNIYLLMLNELKQILRML